MDYKKIKMILFLSFAVILTITALFFINQKYPNTSTVQYVYQKQIKDNLIPKTPLPNKPSPKFIIPDSLLLKVPFTPQAPTANWDELHNEACEEASAIMAAEYFASSTLVTLEPQFVEEQITALTEWQTKTYGYYLDITSAETARMLENFYGLKTKLQTNFTEIDIKTALTKNQLVIISTNGRLLHNPNYKSPGPIHHMLLIKGYTQNDLITNDSGTKRGLNYSYDFKTIYNAAADWDHEKKTVNSNNKVLITVWK